MDPPQMKMLNLLSTTVRQNITCHCKNSPLLRDAKNAIKFKLDNGAIHHKKMRGVVMKVITDDCTVKYQILAIF